MSGNTLVISDTHSPYHHPDLLPFLDELVDTYAPQHTVHIGDESEIKGVLWHAQHPDMYGPQHEYERTKQFFHEELFPRFPRLLLCESNHGGRYGRMMQAANIPKGVREKLTLNRIWEMPSSWRWAQKHTLRDTVFHHGDKSFGRYTSRARKGFGYNTVSGHWHAEGGIAWYTNGHGKAQWAAATGCLIDPKSPCFGYTSVDPVLGTVVIEDGVPIYIPLRTDKHGRWIGRL